jgi:hypothetical protein
VAVPASEFTSFTQFDINAQQTQTILIYATTRILPLNEYSLQKQKFGSLHREERMHKQQKDLNPFLRTMKPISLEENFSIAAKKVEIGSMKF